MRRYNSTACSLILDFDPEGEEFTLQPYVAGRAPVGVAIEDLKAVFHVRTFEGNPDHKPAQESVGEIAEPRFRIAMDGGRKALLEFTDGERGGLPELPGDSVLVEEVERRRQVDVGAGAGGKRCNQPHGPFREHLGRIRRPAGSRC